MPRLKTVLLDRDGTIIKDKHYLSNPDAVELFPDSGEALGSLIEQGLQLFMVSNQSGVGRGYFIESDVLSCNVRLMEQLALYGAKLAGSVFCPHLPEDNCLCRKPAIGMWEQLRSTYNLDALSTLMVGDKQEDMEFAANAKLAGRILVLTGKGQASANALGLSSFIDEAMVWGNSVIPIFNGQHEKSLKDSVLPHYIIKSLADLPKVIALWEQRQEVESTVNNHKEDV